LSKSKQILTPNSSWNKLQMLQILSKSCSKTVKFSVSGVLRRWNLARRSGPSVLVVPYPNPCTTHTYNRFTALWILSKTTQVSWHQEEKHSTTHTCLDHQSTFICFLHLLQSMASYLFNLHAWLSFCTTSVSCTNGVKYGTESTNPCKISPNQCNVSPLHRKTLTIALWIT